MKPQRIIPVALILLTGCVTVAPKITPEMSPVKYSKPENSNAMISGEKFPYFLWYDDNKWDFIDPDSSLFKETEAITKDHNATLNASLKHNNNEVIVVILNASRLRLSCDGILKDIEKRGRNAEIKLIQYDYREVNGNRILFVKYVEQSDSIEWSVANYILANNDGSVLVMAVTQPHLFDEHQNDIFDLLNGLDFAAEGQPNIMEKSNNDIEIKLKAIKELYEKDLITEEEYEKKRAEILESL